MGVNHKIIAYRGVCKTSAFLGVDPDVLQKDLPIRKLQNSITLAVSLITDIV